MTSISSAVLFTGPMFVGKTTTMFGAVAEHANQGARSVIIKHGMDIRGSHDTIFTHNGDKQNSAISIIVAVSIQEALRSVHDKVTVVGVDEGQFFPDIEEQVKYLVEQSNKRVYICGLDGDFNRKPIGNLLQLVPFSDHITKLKSLCSLCRDGTAGVFSFRLTNETDQVIIGSSNYIPLCRECYQAETRKKGCCGGTNA